MELINETELSVALFRNQMEEPVEKPPLPKWGEEQPSEEASAEESEDEPLEEADEEPEASDEEDTDAEEENERTDEFSD